MSAVREVKDRIDSIQSTMKITNAMYMISSTKLNNAKAALNKTEPYYYTLQSVFDRVLRHLPEDFYHPYLDYHEDIAGENRREAIICVTADKGLAGAYNHNVLKLAEEKIRPDGNDMLFVIGEVGRQYFAQRNIAIDEHFQYTAQKPTLGRARKIAEKMLELYNARKVDDVFIVFTRMNSSVEEETVVKQLLPLNRFRNKIALPGAQSVTAATMHEDFKLEPDAETLLDYIVPDYIGGYIYGALVESFASEHTARMQAMDAANKNGKQLISELAIQYNRMRQAQITQEITEVAAGAKARKQQLERVRQRRKEKALLKAKGELPGGDHADR